ncbi:uncharacterized protein LOC132201196 isoform X2 [Neocloeon triangulifer]|uniref:uncharacterized protein LOC132201196 isoform X2 n=1 Tax=Neocloeon triangulifer TaxID=2078957 RepID=UPI00286F2F12|nr:uncharacterized protein LOC132201196 isoform X2 [Neocloeon triangulifer]
MFISKNKKGVEETPVHPTVELLEQTNPAIIPQLVQRKEVQTPRVQTAFKEVHTTHLPTKEPLFEVAAPAETEEVTPDVLQAPPSQPTSTSNRFFRLKLHVILLAVIVRLLLAFDQGHFFGEMVLVPLLVMELPFVIMRASDGQNAGGLLGAALILSGISQTKAHSLLKTICVVQEIASDVAIYLFIFLLSHVAFLWLDIS